MFETLRRLLAGKPEAIQTDQVNLSSLLATILGGRSAPSYHRIKRAAQTNELFKAAINENIRPLITVPFVAEGWDESRQVWVRQPRHPLSRLLDDPNPRYDKVKLLDRFLGDTFCYGNGLLLKRRRRVDRLPGELWPLDSTRVVVTAGEPIEGYYLFVDGSTYVTGSSMAHLPAGHLEKAVASGRARRYDPEDVLHLSLSPDPDWQIWGEAPITPALAALDLDDALTAFLIQFFKRGTVMNWIYTSKAPLGEGEADRMIKGWGQQMAGIDNFWSLGIIDGAEGSLTKVGNDALKELGIHELRMDIESRILAPMNVPPVIVGAVIGLTNTQSYASYEQAREAFYEENAEPNIVRVTTLLTHGLASEFGERGELRVVAATENVMALESYRSQRAKRLNDELRESAITVNEHRSEMGRLGIEGGDVRLQPTRSNPTPVQLKAGTDTEVPITRSRIRSLAKRLSVGTWAECWEVIDKQIKASLPDAETNFDAVQAAVRADLMEHPLHNPDATTAADAGRILLLTHLMSVAYGKKGTTE